MEYPSCTGYVTICPPLVKLLAYSFLKKKNQTAKVTFYVLMYSFP